MGMEGLRDQLDDVTRERDDAWSELEDLDGKYQEKCEEVITYRGEVHTLLKEKSALTEQLTSLKEMLREEKQWHGDARLRFTTKL